MIIYQRKFIIFTISILVCSSTIWYLKNKILLTPDNETISTISQVQSSKDKKLIFDDYSPPRGAVVNAISEKNWTKLAEILNSKKNTETQIENNLSQIIYSLDTVYLNSDNKIFMQEPIFKNLYITLENDQQFNSRSIILISKAFGKMQLNRDQQEKLKQIYLKKKWIRTNYWLDVSISWNKIEKTTEYQLKSLLSQKRSDTFIDYFYYLNKIKDENKLKKLINFSKGELKKFPEHLKSRGLASISNLEQKLNE